MTTELAKKEPEIIDVEVEVIEGTSSEPVTHHTGPSMPNIEIQLNPISLGLLAGFIGAVLGSILSDKSK